ncbi:MAG: dehydrogenase, partial [Rhodobacterales bacterium]|nr:dehydrogenase [Rhodobacterales bacterium]
NADLYPPNYTEAVSITYSKTDRDVTIPDRLQPGGSSSALEKAMYWAVTELPYGKQLRSQVIDPLRLGSNPVVWRNYEASYDVAGLDPGSRKHETYVLLEYFVPVDRFEEFIPLMAEVYEHYDANIANVSIRHCAPDTDTLMTWAPVESYAFVVYYKQGTEPFERTKVGIWTRALNDAVLAVDGTMYLPYQPHALPEQFHQAYPGAADLFALKGRVDPDYRFRNKLWDTYLRPPEPPLLADERAVRQKLAARNDYARPEDQTFLTLPEWSIVYAADELGTFLQHSSPSQFPFFASLAQFWEVYRATAPQTNRYDYNAGYHGMIMTIGVSYTVEYAIRGAYEGTVGALTEWWQGGAVNGLSEDHFAAQYATDYGNFIHATPWYAYPYTTKARDFRALSGTWSIRGLERRFSIYVELYAKAAWGGAMGWASNATFGAETGIIHAWIRRGDVDPETVLGVHIIEELGNDWLLVSLERYEPFTAAIPALVETGASFIEIAGNQTILMTLVAPDSWTGVENVGQLVYEWPILTVPGQKRVAVEVPVSALHLAIPAVAAEGVTLHHIYDY